MAQFIVNLTPVSRYLLYEREVQGRINDVRVFTSRRYVTQAQSASTSCVLEMTISGCILMRSFDNGNNSAEFLHGLEQKFLQKIPN